MAQTDRKKEFEQFMQRVHTFPITLKQLAYVADAEYPKSLSGQSVVKWAHILAVQNKIILRRVGRCNVIFAYNPEGKSV
ncbi:MAG: hypothetical protein NTX79_04860 [Candidatus Micrarchaeota archaeon]|nr:hypothetical protein [Candidatus Micrarchaeota archaeon]